MKVGQTVMAHAKAFDAAGKEVSADHLVWDTDHPEVLQVPPVPARIGASVIATALAPGSALLFARDGVTGRKGGQLVMVDTGEQPIVRIDVTLDAPV